MESDSQSEFEFKKVMKFYKAVKMSICPYIDQTTTDARYVCVCVCDVRFQNYIHAQHSIRSHIDFSIPFSIINIFFFAFHRKTLIEIIRTDIILSLYSLDILTL